jgi:hypothetical protein
MPALRVCACGANLQEAGDALICAGCGAQSRAWRVLLNGRAVGAGTAPWHAPAGDQSVVAFAPRFEAGLLGLLEGPPQPIRYAIASSWRRRGRRSRQTQRDS